MMTSTNMINHRFAIQYISAEQAMAANKAAEIGIRYICFNYGTSLDIVDSLMRDFRETMKKHKTFNGTRKHLFNTALRKMEGVVYLIKNNINTKTEWYEVMDEFQDTTKDACRKLRYSVKAVLDKKGIEDSGYKAEITTIGILLDYTYQMYRTICSDVNKAGGLTATSAAYKPYDCLPIMAWWHKLYDNICHFDGDTSEALGGDANINLALDIISIKLTSDKETHKVYDTVVNRHPDMVREQHKLELKKAKQDVYKSK